MIYKLQTGKVLPIIKKITKPISTAERLGIPKALRSSPKALEDPYYWGYQQWNSRYNAAVNSGNIQEAQRLRDLHFKIKAPNTKVVNENDIPLEVYHFTSNPSIKKFRPSSGKYTSIIWFTSDPTGKGIYYPYDANEGQGKLHTYLNLKTPGVEIHREDPVSWDTNDFYKTFRISPLKKERADALQKRLSSIDRKIVDAYRKKDTPLYNKLEAEQDYLESNLFRRPYQTLSGKQWQIFDLNLPSQKYLYDAMKESGADGLIHNVGKAKHYLSFDPTQIKFSDPITYDDMGNIIPIVKRDNFHNPDMRYKQGGIIKLQNAGSLPKWIEKLNSWFSGIPDSDESAGERILNSTIERANKASTQEERDQIYKDSAKKNLAVTGQSLMMIPMLGEFTTYGLLGGGLRLGTGMAGSKAGEYVLGKGGDWADKKLNTKFLGTTGRILGGLGGWWGGSSATTPLFRNLAGKGITLHMPQETFMNLRGQYFDRAAKNIKLDASTLPKLQYHDRLMKDYLEFGPDSNIYGDNVSKLVHWDPMTTGTKSALPINGGFNRDPIYFPHFENGKLVPAIGQIQSKLGDGRLYTHPYHPIFFGANKPWWEVPKSNLSDMFLESTTVDKSIYSGPRQYFKHWYRNQRRHANNMRKWYEKYGPQNKSARYLITDPENLSNYEFSHKLGIMGSDVPISKLEGFEYDPLLGTFKRAKYIDPSISTIPPQEAATTYHFDGRMPLSRPISEAELKGWPKQFRNQKRGQISASEYSGLPKGERNNGRYGDIRFIRHMDAVPELTKDGFVQVAPEENWLANFTTDQLMVPHKSYPVEGIGKNVLVISPEAFRGTTPFSLDPGDSFFVNHELKIKPKHVTFISGDPQSIQLAKERGFNVETSPKLKILSELSKQATWEELQTMRPALEKRGYWFHGREYPKIKSDYVDELNRILHSRFNRPSLKDYSNIESVTGVPTHTYSRSITPWQSFFGPKIGYQQAIYDTTPQIEHDLMKQIGSYAHPMAESMEGYSPLFFRLLKGWTPIKKQGGKI